MTHWKRSLMREFEHRSLIAKAAQDWARPGFFGPAGVTARRIREGLASLARSLARLSFGALVIVLPLSLRVVLEARRFPPIYRDYTDFLLFAGDAMMVAALLFWGTSLALAPRRLRVGPRLIGVPLVGLTLAGAMSSLASADVALSLYHTLRLVLLGMLYLYVVNEIRSLAAVVLPVALQVLVQAVVGMGQFLQQHSVGLGPFGELALDPAWRGISIVWSGQSVLLRAYGLTDHPNILGGSLAFALVLLAYGYFRAPVRWRAPVVAILGLGLITLLLTFSRAAWLALAAALGLAVLLLVYVRHMHVLKDGFALSVAGLILVLPFAWQYSDYLGVRLNPAEPSMASGENRSLAERDLLNQAAADLFAGHAAFGVGLGAFPLALQAAEPSFPFDYQPAHFVLLEVAAEIGLPGAFFFAVLLLAPWLVLWLKRRRLRADPATLAVIAASGLLLAVTTVGLFDYYTWVLVPGRLWQWLAWGLWGVAYQAWVE